MLIHVNGPAKITFKLIVLSTKQFLSIVKGTGTPVIRESPPQFENRIMARVYVRSITRSTMYQKAPFC